MSEHQYTFIRRPLRPKAKQPKRPMPSKSKPTGPKNVHYPEPMPLRKYAVEVPSAVSMRAIVYAADENQARNVLMELLQDNLAGYAYDSRYQTIEGACGVERVTLSLPATRFVFRNVHDLRFTCLDVVRRPVAYLITENGEQRFVPAEKFNAKAVSPNAEVRALFDGREPPVMVQPEGQVLPNGHVPLRYQRLPLTEDPVYAPPNMTTRDDDEEEEEEEVDFEDE